MYASGRVIGRKLEVADGDAREPIERLERNVLTQLHTVEDRTESREAERISRDRPLEVLVVKQECRKVGELVLVRDREAAAGMVVRDTFVRRRAYRREGNRRDVVALPSDRDRLDEGDLSVEWSSASERAHESQVEAVVRDVPNES